MADDTYVVRNGIIQGVPSKERWFPGDPLPWTPQIVNGITSNIVVDYKRCAKIPEFETRPDDLFITTYPKSGTTWMQQIVKCLKYKGHPEQNDQHLEDIFPWFEVLPQEEMEQKPIPRVYKSHSHYFMVAKGKTPETQCRYIHVMRNPKDVCVSLFHHMHAFADYEYQGPFSEFVDLFLHGKVESGSWFDFVKGWWTQKTDPHVLHTKYEDMQTNPEEVIKKVGKFLDYEVTDEIVKLTIEKSKFSSMKKNPLTNMSWRAEEFREGSEAFMRKGQVGDWKNMFTDEQSKRFDEVFMQKLAGTGLEHEFDL